MPEKNKEKKKEKKLHTQKMSVLKRFFAVVKKIIFKCFGKARWYVLALGINVLVVLYVLFNFGIHMQAEGILIDDKLLKDTPIRSAEDFSVNDNGLAAVKMKLGSYGAMALFRLDTGETMYAGPGGVTIDPMGYNGMMDPTNLALGNNSLYAVNVTYEDRVSSRSIVKESVIRLSEEYQLEKELFVREYDMPGGHRASRISRLHYADGVLTFAVVELDRVYTCRYEETTDQLQYREYLTEADGTYTAGVIPIDGAFLFLRSDGGVYHTEWDEPIGECICRFDPAGTGNAVPFFSQAVVCGEDYYVFDEKEPTKVFLLKDGAVSEIIDIKTISGYADSEIRYIDSCKGGDAKEELILCLTDGLLTWSDGVICDKNVVLRFKPQLINYLFMFLEESTEWIIYALLINLIIRKKTLFYKRMLMTVPVFMVVIIVTAVKVYDYSNEQNNQSIRSEMGIITEFGTRKLEGYDFSGLLSADADTGAEYHRLYEKIRSINTDRTKEWSKNYIFSVVYRTGDTSAVILLDDDTITMPMGKETTIASEQEFLLYDGSGDYYMSENLTGFWTDEAIHNEIASYGKIRDASGRGDIYLKVSTDDRRLWYQRRQLIGAMAGFAAVFILLVVAIDMLVSFYIIRAEKKASGVVQKIANGDFTARVDYKSGDELGEICTQVNAMGRSLEKLFEEKDRTEQFYYKFVPEQFRTLLDKDKFTDLALGDSAGRELTVFSCDIRSFSINSEIMTAKENFEFVNIIYGIAGPIIRKNGGFVDKYIGDAVVALFENAEDAVKSGVEIYRAIVLDPQTAERLGISDINIGIGIHSGHARVGIVGEEERLAGAVISDIVNYSARLEGLTKQYQTAMLISKDTVDRMPDPEKFDLRFLGQTQVAGDEEVLAIYEVLDCLPEEEKTKRERNNIRLRQAISYFQVGKRTEAMAMLKDIAHGAEGDHVTDLLYDYLHQMPENAKDHVFRFVRK
ncbi:MAG: adenylate/guanylate cyclase domain-containing protein [Lachnospiraceae bacterium]|nr:adenylate/guanylate cyclase domain-containing protein [Lachnospiraceae bacterium]